ncbi:MAG: hypothetical protein ABI555_09315 [Chloroflexota bacterium]
MRTDTFVKSSGFALILWALHLLARDYIFAFTHGSSEYDNHLTFLGLSAGQFAMLWTPFTLLGVLGLAGVYGQASPRLRTAGRVGFLVALLGLGMWFVAQVMQVWILDPDRYFHSPLIYGGWLLSLASLFVLTVGLVLAGIDIRRADARPRGRSLILILGILFLPTVFLQAYLVGVSDDSFASKLLYGSLSVPYDLCWLWLGYLLVTATEKHLPEPPDHLP